MSESTTPTPIAGVPLSPYPHMLGLGIDVLFVWYGTKRGGWWHILTVVGVVGGIYNAHQIVRSL